MHLKNYLQKKTSAAPLAVFRIAFGLLMLVSLIRFLAYGWVEKFYIEPIFHFKYFGFEWVQTWGNYTYLLFAVAMVACVGIILGYRYRLSMLLFFLSFSYIELIDKTTYLNHYYFISLLSFVLIFLPLHGFFSLDADRKGKAYTLAPAWTLDCIKICLGLVYFYAGLAKLNSDWLLRAQPLTIWLSSQTDIPVVASWFRESWFHYFMSWSGALYDLLIPFALLYRPTRALAFVAVLFFHLLTGYLFPIGMFPYIMIVSSTIFFSTAFHARILRFIGGKIRNIIPRGNNVESPKTYSLSFAKSIRTGLAVLLVLQILMPFRHLLYSSELFWSEEGYRFSWRVMLTEKSAYTRFKVVDEATERVEWIDDAEFLTDFQQKQMSFQADFILEYAHFLAQHYKKKGMQAPKVFVESWVALNGRKAQLFIDPKVDLTTQKEGFQPKTWIIPFNDEISGL